MELGYAATSMDLVAQRAHASKTTLYKRFPSKESLFSACIAAECEARGLNFPVAAFAELPVNRALAEIGIRLLDLLWSPEAIRMEQIVSGEAARFPEVAHLYFEAGPKSPPPPPKSATAPVARSSKENAEVSGAGIS